MTITNENRKTDLVIDDSSLFTFSYTFDIIAEETIGITFFDEDGVEVEVVMTRVTSSSPSANEFFVDKDNSQVKIGGTGTLQSQYSTDITQLLIVRTVDLTQEETFPTATNFQADAIETSLDKNTMGTQQINETLARCLRIPIQDDTDQNVDLDAAAVRANKFLAFDALGNPTVASSVEGGATVSTAMEPVIAAATLAVARTLLDLYTTGEVDDLLTALSALKLNLAGGTMSGAIAMGTKKITGLGNPTAAQDAATQVYVKTGAWTPAATYAGEESITFPNGLILKHGLKVASTNALHTITFGGVGTEVPFPNGIVSVNVIQKTSQNDDVDISVEGNPSVDSFAVRLANVNFTTGIYWQAWGY